MAQTGGRVPKFGDWGSNQNEPFTRAFEVARAGKGGVLIIPADNYTSEAFIMGEQITGFAAPPPTKGNSSTRDSDSSHYAKNDHSANLPGEAGQLQTQAEPTSSKVQADRLQLKGDELHETLPTTGPPKAASVGPPIQLDSASSLAHKSDTKRRRSGSRVPKFGDWDSNETEPFTKVFETARAGKGGKLEMDSIIRTDVVGFTAPPPKQALLIEVMPASLTRHGAHTNTKDGQQETVNKESNAQTDLSHTVANGTATLKTPAAAHQIDTEDEPTGQPEQIDLTHSQTHNGVSGTKAERASPVTPGKSRPHLVNAVSRTEESVDKSAALPKFGEWDVKNPASGEGFTMIFNNARNERKTGGSGRPLQLQAKVTSQKDEEILSKQQQPTKQKSSSLLSCCFQPQTTT
ncbi:hypothetical protein O6H91_09G003700 [Diphasiastrum complanatum]|uniref:Uncharacterized protein n=1 Tax=Diphasiastrum complanatum TaxID=34168 RepID=A0ACC2CKV5_DIPCM|nr:hypothetical protein O6H91_09G003700 [Diphasiastrum complanatum]